MQSANTQKEMLAWAIAHGDLFCAKIALSLTDDKLLAADSLSRFSYLIPDNSSAGMNAGADEKILQRRGMVNEMFREALDSLTDEMLNAESLSEQMLAQIAQNALKLKKISFASKAYDELGEKEKVSSDYIKAGDSLLAEGKIQPAVENYLIAAKLAYDHKLTFGPNFQQRGLQLHADCMNQPTNCITASPDMQTIIDEGIEYLINNQRIAEKFRQQPLPVKQSLLKVCAQLQDSNLPVFVENYKAAVQKLKDATKDYEAGKISDEFRLEEVQQAEEQHQTGSLSSEGLERIKQNNLLEDNWEKLLDVQQTLLGRAIAEDNFLQYIRELLWEHPVSALVVCIKYEHQSRPVVIPARQDSKSLVELLGLD